MKRYLSLAILLFSMMSLVSAETAPDSAELTAMLNEFLAGASRNDPAAHERFWAEDLIYTGSSGRRVSKADILKDVRSAPKPKPEDPSVSYTAEDIRIQQYGTTAIVAFRLVGTTRTGSKVDVANYLNSGTFLKRDGQWRVVNWQATRMPRPEDAVKKEITETTNTFHQTMSAGNAKALENLLDETFLWTQTNGDKVNRKQLLESITSGALKYTSMENNNTSVEVYGSDTAVVRGVTKRQRSAIPGSASPDTSPFTAYYTLTFVRRDTDWKLAAMHTSKECK